MSFEFTMVLNRQVTDGEAEQLRTSGCGDATFTTATVGVEKDQEVTQLDFKTDAPSLAEAITAALEAVKAVPELTTTSLTVPPYGGNPPPPDEESGPEGKTIQGQAETVSTESVNGSADNAEAPTEAAAVPEAEAEPEAEPEPEPEPEPEAQPEPEAAAVPEALPTEADAALADGQQG